MKIRGRIATNSGDLGKRYDSTDIGAGHIGAGDGNRTRIASLEGWNSTIELHPRLISAMAEALELVKARLRTLVRGAFSPGLKRVEGLETALFEHLR